jgi:hypothetical protein
MVLDENREVKSAREITDIRLEIAVGMEAGRYVDWFVLEEHAWAVGHLVMPDPVFPTTLCQSS